VREAIVYFFFIVNTEKFGWIHEDGTPSIVEMDESFFLKLNITEV
jgi:hypothetical protein